MDRGPLRVHGPSDDLKDTRGPLLLSIGSAGLDPSIRGLPCRRNTVGAVREPPDPRNDRDGASPGMGGNETANMRSSNLALEADYDWTRRVTTDTLRGRLQRGPAEQEHGTFDT